MRDGSELGARRLSRRGLAGDIFAGEQFLQELAPFVWRKYFDFAAIADVHSIKRQIHAHKGHGKIAVAGHNIKLGRGGIREIEFFVQTQQLITGRSPARARHGDARPARRSGWVAPGATLREAYLFCARRHRIRWSPTSRSTRCPRLKRRRRIGRMMGFAGARFAEALQPTWSEHYAVSAPSAHPRPAIRLHRHDDDPGTIETLANMGFASPKTVTATIRGWHFGRYAATRSTVARERLTELTPILLEAIAATENADAAFLAFDRLISKLPAGVQLFSLLVSQPRLLKLLAAIGAAKLANDLPAPARRRSDGATFLRHPDAGG
jgi:glutamate-ammonia-ligase adenylyltransferase